MITKRVISNVIFFLALALTLIVYGFVNLLDSPFAQKNTVSTVFPESAGIREDFSASYNGVTVGKVSKVELVNQGVRVTVVLDRGIDVPNNVEASIFRANAVGEQRVDYSIQGGGDELRGQHARAAEAEPLENGDVVPPADNPLPPDLNRFLLVLEDLVAALPEDDLNTVVHEASAGIAGRAEDIHSLVRDLTAFSEEFLRSEPEFRRLLAVGPPVLRDLIASSDDFHRALDNTAELTDLLADNRTDLVTLLNTLADGSADLNRLVLDTRANLDCLLGDAATLVDFAVEPDEIGPQTRPSRLDLLDYVLNNSNQTLEGGLIDNSTVEGPSKANGGLSLPGSPDVGGTARPDQTWIRIRFLIPTPPPPASSYEPYRPMAPTRPGGACESVYPGGAGPVRQADAAPLEPEEQGDGRLVLASSLTGTGLPMVALGVLVVGLWLVTIPNRRIRRSRP